MVVVYFSHLYTIQEQFFEQRIWDKLWYYCNKYFCSILLNFFLFQLITLVEFLFLTNLDFES